MVDNMVFEKYFIKPVKIKIIIYFYTGETNNTAWGF